MWGKILIFIALMFSLGTAWLGIMVFNWLVNYKVIVPDSFNLAEFWISMGIFILVLVALILHIKECLK